MTAPDRTEDGGVAVRTLTVWDRAAIALLGTAGFALSYDALMQVATAIHVRDALTFLFPLVIDGFIAYGVRALVLLRGQRAGARLYAWTLFAAATCASIWANALHAIKLNDGPSARPGTLELGDAVVGVLSMLAPLALAGSVHLYILMARTVDGPSAADQPTPENTSTVVDAPEPVQATLVCTPALTQTDADHAPPASGPSAEEDELLPLAREAVAKAGRTNRTVVASALRSRGHRIGNERLGALLARLREENADRDSVSSLTH